MSIPSGASIGSVVVEHRIATDPSGDISLARQPALDRSVILRRLRRDLLSSERHVERFQREARYGARIIHPNIVQVFDCFSYAGDRYLIMEHVEGSDLRSILDRGRPLPPRIAAQICRELCRGLQEIHSRRLVHADLRPEYVHVSRWGEVKLTGFGGARELGAEGPPIDASPYRAPEAEADGPLGWGADLWSLGVLLRELMTGDPKPDRRRQIPDRALARLVARCTRPDPEKRPSARQAGELLARRAGDPSPADSRSEIAAWLWEARIFRPRSMEAEPERIRPASQPPRARRLRWLPIAGALAGTVAVIALAVARRDGAPERAPEPVRAAEAPAPAEPEMPQVSAARPTAADPALVSFVAYPWAEIQIDGGERFLTPRAEPVSLAPGIHEVIFRHPRFGEQRRRLAVSSGQQDVVRHVFLATSSR
jgi:hypothetical protein